MKMKTLAVMGLLAVSMASSVHAQTVLRINGSTAFRPAVHNAIGNILRSGFSAGYIGTTLSGANAAVFVGTTTSAYGNVPVVIQTFWTGSATGDLNVNAQTSLPSAWLTNTGAQLAAAGNGAFPTIISGGKQIGTAASAGRYDASAPANASLSDVWDTAVPTDTSVTFALTDAANPTGTSTGAQGVGAVAFTWAAGTGATTTNTVTATTKVTGTTATLSGVSGTGLTVGYAISGNPHIAIGTTVAAISGSTVTLSQNAVSTDTTGTATSYTALGLVNVSNQLAEAIIHQGKLPLSQFTGFSGDSSTSVFLVGRSPDSGTRADAIQEAYEGLDLDFSAESQGISFPTQYYPIDGSSNIVGDPLSSGAVDFATINTFILTPPDGSNVAYFGTVTTGHSGYNSGGNLADALESPNGTSSDWIAYVGVSDAQNAINGTGKAGVTTPAVQLQYNGFLYSPEAIQLGNYTFWSFEHLYYQSSASGGFVTLAQDIAKQLALTTVGDSQVSGVLVSSLTVNRHNPVSSFGVTANDGIVVF